MKWYVVVEPQKDGQNYVGICEYYGGEEKEPGFISLHDIEAEADAACIKYAQEQGLPLFADYREGSAENKICHNCKCLGIDCAGMSSHFTGCIYFISANTEKPQATTQG